MVGACGLWSFLLLFYPVLRLIIYPLLLASGLIFFSFWSSLVTPCPPFEPCERFQEDPCCSWSFSSFAYFFFPFFVRSGLGLIVEVEVEPLPPMRRQASEASGAPSHYREAIKEFPYSFFSPLPGRLSPSVLPLPVSSLTGGAVC